MAIKCVFGDLFSICVQVPVFTTFSHLDASITIQSHGNYDENCIHSNKQTNEKKIHKNICELLMVVPWTNHVKSNYTEQLSHSYDYTCTYYQCHTNFYFIFNCGTMTTIYCLTKVTFLHLISFNNEKKPSVKQMRNEFKSLFKPFSISL